MTKGRVAVMALVAGVAVGTRARQRTAAALRRSPSLVTHQLRTELTAVERGVEREVERLDRDRRRTAATVLAIAILVVIPAVLVSTRPEVPEWIVAVVLGLDLLVAAAAIAAAAWTGRSRRRPGSRPQVR